MHASSMENMRRCIDWYLGEGVIKAVDLGSMNVNGSYRELLPPTVDYVGVDLEAGPGVDVVLEDVYRLPFEDRSVDLVLSGQMLEHSGQFWRVFNEMSRILKPGGLAFVIAPSAGPVHRYPVDCYRFYPDSYQALGEWSALRLIQSWTDDRGPWCDIVGIFQKGDGVAPVQEPRQYAIAANSHQTPHADPAAEVVSGARSYLEVLGELHGLINPRTYLEIGVRRGSSLALATGPAIAIDPEPHPDFVPDRPNLRFYRCTSDDFFFFHAPHLAPASIDLAFIDGMHLAENVYRDFINVERLMHPDGVIVIDDVLPNHQIQASRERQSQVWTGDVWRFAEFLAQKRPDLHLTWLNTAPSGLLVISRLDPGNTLLRSEYNPLMRTLASEAGAPVPDHLLTRANATAPTIENLRAAVNPALAQKRVDLSILVCAYDMQRELPRTLHTLSAAYQQGMDGLSWEVVVLDNGSQPPVDEAALQAILPGVRVIRPDIIKVSPATAINMAMNQLKGTLLGLWIDGARMASPGILRHAVDAWRADPDRVIGTTAFHLGPDVQMRTVLQGYDAAAEDALLGSIPWQMDGYRLFDISVLAGSSAAGWFGNINETNGLFLDRKLWNSLGGLDDRFEQPGGGFVNLDLWERAVAASQGHPWMILGEGTFHQVHGGAATNGLEEQRAAMHAEYVALHGRHFAPVRYVPRFVGALDARRFESGAARALDRDRGVHSVRGRPFRVDLPGEALSRIQSGTLRTRYKGLRLAKNPFDLALYMQAIEGLRPRTIIEIGTSEGGSAVWLSDQCKALGLTDTRLISIDIAPPALEVPDVRFHQGDSYAPEASFPTAEIAAAPHPWLVIEDSAHTYGSTASVLDYFDRFMLPGDLLVVEDGVVADLEGENYRAFADGPNRAVAHFLDRMGARYEIDAGMCDFYGPNLTYAPNAWLRRI